MARNKHWHTVAVVSIVSFMTGLVPGCGSDDNGGMSTTPCLALQGTTTPAPLSVVVEQGTSGDCNLLYVDLVVGDVDDLFGADIVMTFPSNLVAFVSASESGSVLTSGAPVSVQAAVTGTGELTAGISRLGANVDGVDVSGGQRLLRLIFQRVGSQGSGSLGFTKLDLYQPNPGPPPPPVILIPNIQRFGATVVILQT